MVNKKPFLILGLIVMLLGPALSPLIADTLRLKNGQWVEGSYLGGNASSIRFRVNGIAKNYANSTVDQVQFGNGAGVISQRFITFQNSMLSLRHPDNWQATQD